MYSFRSTFYTSISGNCIPDFPRQICILLYIIQYTIQYTYMYVCILVCTGNKYVPLLPHKGLKEPPLSRR